MQQLANLTYWEINTIRWESRNIAIQPGEIDDRKSEIIVFVVNAGMNITANYFYTQIKERSFFIWSMFFVQLKFCWIFIRNMFLKFRVTDGEYIVKISRGVVKQIYKVVPFRFVKVRYKIPLITNLKQIRYEWSTVCTHRNPPLFVDKPCLQIAHIYFHEESKSLKNCTILKAMDWCFCGNKLEPGYEKADDKDCNLPCPGNKAQTCGGHWRMAVYIVY